MAETILYKYLDADGGLKMLNNSNLQFTNATRLNDPFECHPSLIDFSKIPEDNQMLKNWGKEAAIDLASNPYERLRNDAWICSLSKIHDSILMWSYYGNQQGICIGLNKDKVMECLSKVMNGVWIGAQLLEVQYKDMLEKPDYYHEPHNYYNYVLATKAKAWEHEREVRILLMDSAFVQERVPDYIKEEYVDVREFRKLPKLTGDCFESLYLGIHIDAEKREEIIEAAQKLNPKIKIYQMTIDPEALKLKEDKIEF